MMEEMEDRGVWELNLELLTTFATLTEKRSMKKEEEIYV